MVQKRFTYYKGKVTKWLLTVTLFVSIFTFAEYVNNTPSQPHITQTELVFSNNNSKSKRTISYKKVLKLTCYYTPINRCNKYWAYNLLVYDIRTNVKIDNIAKQFLPNIPAFRFLQVKTIPQSSTEDISSILKG